MPVIGIALIPWAIRLSAGSFPFKRTSMDWFIILFQVTAWIGFWAAYDRESAWSKIWLISLAVLLYYALAAQPLENLDLVCIGLFCTGVGVSFYFFLTHDFVLLPRRLEFVNQIGRWVMEMRPDIEWTPIHPNYVAGIVAITTPFILYPAARWMEASRSRSAAPYLLVLLGFGVAVTAILMSTSRGILLAIVTAFGTLILWRMVHFIATRLRLRPEAIFPPL
ncbi:MAG TPA: hypothetical protein VK880_00965, partial [Anaerolineales bacterium]|nr:hypothetical protein [Anaerolineales bacterium]